MSPKNFARSARLFAGQTNLIHNFLGGPFATDFGCVQARPQMSPFWEFCSAHHFNSTG